MKTMKKITVVSPCYNEEDNVEICARTVREIFERDLPGYAREHIFIDNASGDRTVEILRGLAAADPSIKIVVNARNFGVFRSTFNGLRHATGDVLAEVPRQRELDPVQAHGDIIEVGCVGCQAALALPALAVASPRSSFSSNCPQASSARRRSSK